MKPHDLIFRISGVPDPLIVGSAIEHTEDGAQVYGKTRSAVSHAVGNGIHNEKTQALHYPRGEVQHYIHQRQSNYVAGELGAEEGEAIEEYEHHGDHGKAQQVIYHRPGVVSGCVDKHCKAKNNNIAHDGRENTRQRNGEEHALTLYGEAGYAGHGFGVIKEAPYSHGG